jgi:hypothetical protein
MMTMMMAAALAQAASDRWVEVSRDTSQTSYIDTQSIQRRGSVATAWLRTELETPLEEGATSLMFQNEFDCSARTYTLVAWHHRSGDDKTVSEGSVPATERRASPVLPETQGEDEFDIACR